MKPFYKTFRIMVILGIASLEGCEVYEVPPTPYHSPYYYRSVSSDLTSSPVIYDTYPYNSYPYDVYPYYGYPYYGGVYYYGGGPHRHRHWR